MSFSYSQTGLKSVQRRLQALTDRAPHALRDVAQEANTRHAQAYRRRRIPEATGRLKASLTQERHPERVVRITRRGLTLGTRVPYAQYQEQRIRRLSPRELRDIFIDPITQHLTEVLRGRG